MSTLPLCSSVELTNALERLGWTAHNRNRGSHRTYVKQLGDGTYRTVTVVLGKREIPRGTLASILRRTGITRDEFVEALK